MSNPNYQPNKEKEPELEIPENIAFHQISEPYTKQEHVWIQKGPDILCTSCPAPHGVRVGVHKRLTGFDKRGNMIIETI